MLSIEKMLKLLEDENFLPQQQTLYAALLTFVPQARSLLHSRVSDVSLFLFDSVNRTTNTFIHDDPYSVIDEVTDFLTNL